MTLHTPPMRPTFQRLPVSGRTPPALGQFISQSIERSRALRQPADCVLALAPLMLDLIRAAGTRHRIEGAHNQS